MQSYANFLLRYINSRRYYAIQCMYFCLKKFCHIYNFQDTSIQIFYNNLNVSKTILQYTADKQLWFTKKNISRDARTRELPLFYFRSNLNLSFIRIVEFYMTSINCLHMPNIRNKLFLKQKIDHNIINIHITSL